MITNKFSQALAPLLSTANIISPTSTLDKEAQLHLPADPTARPFDFPLNQIVTATLRIFSQ